MCLVVKPVTDSRLVGELVSCIRHIRPLSWYTLPVVHWFWGHFSLSDANVQHADTFRMEALCTPSDGGLRAMQCAIYLFLLELLCVKMCFICLLLLSYAKRISKIVIIFVNSTSKLYCYSNRKSIFPCTIEPFLCEPDSMSPNFFSCATWAALGSMTYEALVGCACTVYIFLFTI